METVSQEQITKEPELNMPLQEYTESDNNEIEEKGWTFQDRRPFSVKEDIVSLRYKKEWCDTVIKVGQSTTLAHKAVLSAGCKLFDGMFRLDFLENITNQIDLSHLFSDISMANVFIDYLYTGRVLLCDNNIESILKMAHMTLMQNLMNHCVQFLLHRLGVANVISTMELAERYDITRLIEVCDSFLQKSEDLLVFSPEIKHMNSQNFLGFLKTDVISNYDASVRSSLILCWLSTDIPKRSVYVERYFQTNQPSKHIIKHLPLSSKKRRQLLTWSGRVKLLNEIPAVIKNESLIEHFPVIENSTIVVQSHCGKTAFFCQELTKWYVLNLPVIEGDLLGFLEDNSLVYLETEINAITCVRLPCGTIKRTAIPGSCPQHTYKNCEFGSAQPYHYFCQHGRLYGINPITSAQWHLKIIGWGVYRYFHGKESGWQQLGDIIFWRDFDKYFHQKSEVMMLPIYDPGEENLKKPVVYLFLQKMGTSSDDVSVTFLYNQQVQEYYSFTVWKSFASKSLDIFVFPEVLFISRFETLIGLIDLPVELIFSEEDSTGILQLSIEKRNSILKWSDSIVLNISKPPHLPLRIRWTLPVESPTSGNKTTLLCPFTSSKQVAIFDGNIYLAAHLSPLDYQIIVYDFNNYPCGTFPPVPFPTHCETRMTPIRTMKPISLLFEECKIKNITRDSSKQNVTKRIFRDWVFSTWEGQYNIMNDSTI